MGRIFGLCFCFFCFCFCKFLFLYINLFLFQSMPLFLFLLLLFIFLFLFIPIMCFCVCFCFCLGKSLPQPHPKMGRQADVAEPCFLLTPPRFLCVFLLRLSVDTLVEVRVRCFHWFKTICKTFTYDATHGRTDVTGKKYVKRPMLDKYRGTLQVFYTKGYVRYRTTGRIR